VEVVKGPTGTLFGGAAGGPLGGLVNYVSKRPQKDASYMFGINAGSWGAYGNIWDVNQPLDREGRVIFRLTGDVRETRDVNPFIKGHLTSFFPTLAISLSDDTTLTLRGRYSDRSQTDYSGLPAAGTVNASGITLDRYTIFRAEGQPATAAKNRSIAAELKHNFNDDWNFILEASYSDMNFDQYSTWAAPVPPVGTTYFVNMATLLQNMHSFAFNARLNGKFDTGPLKHTLTAGMDFDQTSDNALLLFNIGAGVLDVSNPVYPNFVFGGVPFGMQENDYQTLAFFLQDQITIAERVHLLGSLRWTRFNVHDVDPAAALDSELTEHRFTGRLGLSVDVTEWMTVFGGWGQGFQAPIGVPIAGGKKLIEGEQWEAGFKFQLADTLQASVSWFHNERTNMPVPVGFTNVQSGVQRSQGFEADLVWQPTRELSVLLNYAYQDAEVISSTAVPVGSRLPRVPAHSGRVAVRYDFREGTFKGFGAGLGVTLASARAGDAANTFYTPSYATVDAQLSYNRGPATLSIGIQNLLDARYYETYAFLGGAVSPNAPFNVFCQATVRF
jgi:iron complex outermembrane receptor protein